MEESSKQYWHQKDDLLGEEEELLTMMGDELLDERTVYAPVDYSNNKHHQGGEEEEPRRRQESMMVNKLISTVYSGPTVSDIESALSFTGGGDHQQQLKYIISTSSPAVFSPEKVMENKYTLKMKTCGNGLAEDGYKWRKYGQKSIKNSPNPRSYYRCTNPRCNAKKQVERATDEPDTLVVTYEGLHLHYTYSHFLHAAQAQKQQGLPKKPKRANTSHDDEGSLSPSSLALDALPVAAAAWGYSDGGDEQQQQQQEEDMVATSNGGLLEDVVPLLVRRPCGSTTPGSPPSNNNSSVSWTPYTDMAILSNIF